MDIITDVSVIFVGILKDNVRREPNINAYWGKVQHLLLIHIFNIIWENLFQLYPSIHHKFLMSVLISFSVAVIEYFD